MSGRAVYAHPTLGHVRLARIVKPLRTAWEDTLFTVEVTDGKQYDVKRGSLTMIKPPDWDLIEAEDQMTGRGIA